MADEAAPPLPTIAEAERDLIVRALARYNNNDHAARAIGLNRRTFYRRLKTYGIESPRRRGRPARAAAAEPAI